MKLTELIARLIELQEQGHSQVDVVFKTWDESDDDYCFIDVDRAELGSLHHVQVIVLS
jgi:hypothetical protein